MRAGELGIHAVLLALGIFVVVMSVLMGVGTLTRPGPGVFPLLVGVLLVLSALAGLGDRRAAPGKPALGGAVRPVGLVVVVFVMWAALTPVLGYLVTTFVAVVAVAKIMRLPTWWKPLALALATTAMAYVLFDWWLGVDLPRWFL